VQEAAASVARAGGLPALVTALNCSDPQAQCFASAAIGASNPRERCGHVHARGCIWACHSPSLRCAPASQNCARAMFAGSLAVSKDDRIAASLAQQGMAPALQQMLQADSTVRTLESQHLGGVEVLTSSHS
jgi:hypothetical protein